MASGVREVAVGKLRCAERNPRTIRGPRLEQLKRSLVADREMLRARPLVALPDGTVLMGNQRLRAALELGWKTLPVLTVELDAERAKLWMLRDNQGYGEWDEPLLSELLAELSAADVDLDLTGFGEQELVAFLASVGDGQTEPDAVPEPPAKANSRPGEVYELGSHRVMCGDSACEGDMSQLAGAGAASEAIWTDPPYGVSYVGKTAEALTISNDGADGLKELLQAAWRAAEPVLAPAARFYCAAPPGPRELDFRLAFEEVGWRIHQTLIWAKDVFVLGHSDYHYAHEPILYGYLPGPGRPGRGKHAGSRWYGDHAQSSVFVIPRPRRSAEHPTMKPVELISAQLVNSTQVGDAVLDPFAGSGSTLIACEQLGRRCLAMEIDPRFVDVIRQRYADYTGQPKLAPSTNGR